QNYPNPFNVSSTIGYVVPGLVSATSPPALVNLTVYDVLGRSVATLVNGNQAPGEYFARFDGTGRSSGVYFYRLEIQSPGTGSTSAVRKMVFIK
ncbi:MAG TPA: T9SS type A sorting domain-containing protein, partial [Bacteroidota bacterium]|nr:T9SS type A sorting domain-containing protein [Bacteroidota bacterium]